MFCDLLGISSSGFAQAALDLDPGSSYFVTLRGITNGGNILQATTNGFLVDTTGPNVAFKKSDLFLFIPN